MTRTMTSHRAFAALLLAALLASCDKNAVQQIGGPVAESQIRFFNFGVNAPAVNFYANDVKVTAVSSATGTESTNGVASGGVGSGGLYSALEPGQYTFAGKIAATVDKDLAISTVPATLEAGKKYTMYISGLYNVTAKTAEGFIVEDPLPAQIDFTQAYVRFVNAISNANPMQLFVKNSTTGVETAIGNAVSYKGAGAFIAVPGASYDLVTRYAGGTTSVITRAAVALSAGRVYTIGARGDITVTSTTAATRPQLDNTANR